MAMMKYVQYGLLSGEIYATVNSVTPPNPNLSLRLQRAYPEGTNTNGMKVNIITLLLEAIF